MPLLNISMPFELFFNSDGTALENGYIYIGEANKNAEVFPISVYWDADLSIPAAQPIRTLNGYPSNNGSPGKLYADAISCSMITKDSQRNLVLSELDFTGLGNISSVIQLVSSKAIAQSIAPTSTRDLFIQGADGGQFYAVTGAAPATYAEDGGSYCGTVILPTGGDGSSAWLRVGYRTGDVDGEWYGMQLDGSDDAAALMAAANALGSAGGVVNIKQSFTTGAITWPSLSSWLDIRWFGTWTTTATIPVKDYMALKGQGGYNANQFATKAPTAQIIASGSVSPVIEVTGSVKKLLKDFQVSSIDGVGIKLNGYSALGALATLDNVHVTCQNLSTAEIPLLIDHYFWVWLNDCVFFGNSNTGPTIHITQTNGSTAGSYSGLIYGKNLILNVQGISIDCPRTSGSVPVMTEMHFDELTFENCESALCTIDMTNTVLSNLTFNKVTIADQVSLTEIFNTTGPYNRIRNIKYKNSSLIAGLPIVSGTEINGFELDTKDVIDYSTGIDLGDQKHHNSTFLNLNYARQSGRGSNMSPSLVPYDTLNFPQDLSTWTDSGTITVTGGQLAPDGTSTAFKFVSGAGNAFKYYNAYYTIAVGDYFIIGVWQKPSTADKTAFVQNSIDLPTPAGQVWESSGATTHSLQYKCPEIYMLNSGWYPLVTHGKISAIGTQPALVRFFLGAEPTTDMLYWKPFIIHLPATLGFTEADVIRIKQHITNLPANVVSAGDVVTMHDHHKFRIGQGGNWQGGTAAPVSGTWIKGDIVWNTNGSADGNSMVIIGWYCTVSGSPGTWVALYASTVSPAI